MPFDIGAFFRACNPSKTLNLTAPEDKNTTSIFRACGAAIWCGKCSAQSPFLDKNRPASFLLGTSAAANQLSFHAYSES